MVFGWGFMLGFVVDNWLVMLARRTLVGSVEVLLLFSFSLEVILFEFSVYGSVRIAIGGFLGCQPRLRSMG